MKTVAEPLFAPPTNNVFADKKVETSVVEKPKEEEKKKPMFGVATQSMFGNSNAPKT